MKKNHLKFEMTYIFQFQFSCTNFNGAPNFVIIFPTSELDYFCNCSFAVRTSFFSKDKGRKYNLLYFL